jgi:hypothetical protein
MKPSAWLLAFSIGISLVVAQACAAQAEQGPPPEKSESTQSPVKTPPPQQPANAGGNDSPVRDEDYTTTLGPAFFKHILLDQKAIWTSPAKIRTDDAVWLVPLGGFAATLFATDKDTSKHLNGNPNTLNRFDNISNYGAYAMIGVGGGMYLLGKMQADDQKRETGLLSGEAAIDSLAVVEALKYTTGRARPYQDNGTGDFWQGGTSFPSEHAAIAWSIAGILAHEYPGPLTQILSYGLATTISVSRAEARKHFASDVLVGSAIGWLTSEYVYRTHHNPELGGGGWEHFPVHSEQGSWKANDMGSPYVQLDSWIYPALDRLRGLGYIDSAILGLRPWTRRECARLVNEAGDRIRSAAESPNEAYKIYTALVGEFSVEISLLSGGKNGQVQLESAYTTVTDISGKTINDGYHFAQTIINDYGRPYAEGINTQVGASGYATEGPFVAYARGEYQYAPFLPSLPEPALQLIPQIDGGLPAAPPTSARGTVNRLRLLDAYGGFNFHDYQITFGQQSQWWGPGEGGPMIFSDNVEPIRMFAINRVTPFKLPWIFGLMGPMRAEFILGQLAGQHWLFGPLGFVGGWGTLLNPQPFIEGQKFSFKPTSNVEFGFSRTVLFAGQSVPFTWHQFSQGFFTTANGGPGTPNDGGDRRSGFDMNYRLPFMRNFATFYADGFVEDNFSPVAYWDRAAWSSGLYLSQIPGLPNIDFRAEGTYTDDPTGFRGGSPFYSNDRYHSGYTQFGNIIGSWIGREGQGGQVWLNYWFSPRSKLQFNARHQKVSHNFIPDGGTLTDVGVEADILAGRHWSILGGLKYEDWIFPIIAPGHQRNVATTLQATFWPGTLGKLPH